MFGFCMRRKLLYTLVLVVVSPIVSGQAAKKRVAVIDFDSSLSQPAVVLPFVQTTQPNTGKAIADLLLTRLVQDGLVDVIERSAIDKLLEEQNLSNSNRLDPQTAATIGRILGVDAVIFGTVTEYTFDDKTTGGRPAGFAGIGGNPYNTKHDMTGRVQVSARLVSPDTAEVLAVAAGLGEIVRKGVKVDVRDARRNALNPTGAGGTLMADATALSVAQLNENLKPNFAKIPARAHVIEGLVADANESGQLVLNTGSRDGVKAGDRLQIWRSGKEIRDPKTGKVLLRDDALLGEAIVTEVGEEFARAAYQGAEPVKVGDLVRDLPKAPSPH